MHDEATLATRPANAVFHDEGSLIYNYSVEGPSHQIIFTDSRSWRSFPTGSVGGGVLLPTEQLTQQIVAMFEETSAATLSLEREAAQLRDVLGQFQTDDPQTQTTWAGYQAA